MARPVEVKQHGWNRTADSKQGTAYLGFAPIGQNRSTGWGHQGPRSKSSLPKSFQIVRSLSGIAEDRSVVRNCSGETLRGSNSISRFLNGEWLTARAAAEAASTRKAANCGKDDEAFDRSEFHAIFDQRKAAKRIGQVEDTAASKSTGLWARMDMLFMPRFFLPPCGS